jgi:predicted MPP superfamily phosphohydrolase
MNPHRPQVVRSQDGIAQSPSTPAAPAGAPGPTTPPPEDQSSVSTQIPSIFTQRPHEATFEDLLHALKLAGRDMLSRVLRVFSERNTIPTAAPFAEAFPHRRESAPSPSTKGSLLPQRASDPWAFRTPAYPEPLEVFRIEHPDLPVGLDGLRILHLSDLHIRRLERTDDHADLLAALRHADCDLAFFTGDYHDGTGHEHAAAELLGEIIAACPARLGRFGVFGNHDTPLMRRLALGIPGITWLNNQLADPISVTPGQPPLPVRILGLSYPEDLLQCALNLPMGETLLPTKGRFVLTLAHMPSVLAACAEVGLPLVFAGHTHAGQIRITRRSALHTSSDLPGHLASGVLRLRQTLCCISRGLGDGIWPGLRINCPRQLPLYILTRGPLSAPLAPTHAKPNHLACVRAW